MQVHTHFSNFSPGPPSQAQTTRQSFWETQTVNSRSAWIPSNTPKDAPDPGITSGWPAHLNLAGSYVLENSYPHGSDHGYTPSPCIGTCVYIPCVRHTCNLTYLSAEAAQSLHTPRDHFKNLAARGFVVVAHVDARQPAVQGRSPILCMYKCI